MSLKYKIMKNNSLEEKPDIEFLVLKNFISVVKKKGMYPLFRCSVGWDTNNVISSIYRRMYSFQNLMKNQSNENIYKDAGNIDMFLELMKASLKEHGFSNNNPAEIQHHVANCVNCLIHIFIERRVRDYKILESIGGEIFDRTCREIFGGDFEDLLPAPPQNLEKIRDINQRIMENGGRPTQEMLEELRRVVEEQRGVTPEMVEEFRRRANVEDNPIRQLNDEDFQVNDFLGDLINGEDEDFEDGDDWEEDGVWDDVETEFFDEPQDDRGWQF